MNNTVAGLLVRAFAGNARVAGMQAENHARLTKGESPAYTETDFNAEADALDHCASAIFDAAHYV